MKILSFIEGARISAGGIGIPSVPEICNSLASRDSKVILVSSGAPISGSKDWISLTRIKSFNEIDRFEILQYPAWEDRWCFNPAIYFDCNQLAKEADCILLNSLYSFPVLMGYEFARKYQKPYLLWPHGVLAPFQRTVGKKKKSIYNKLFANQILNRASGIVYTAEGERDEARSLCIKSRSIVIPLGMSLEIFTELPDKSSFRKKFLHGIKGPIILFLGRLNAKKGLDILIQAMKNVIASIPDAILVITGGSDPKSFEQKVLNWIKENGIENNIVMTGVLIGEEKLELFSAADILVLPSIAENFGFAVFEAMASGIPVVVSDTLNYANEIQRYGAGLALPRDPKDISEAIMKLLEHSEMRREMGIKGKNFVKNFTWDKTSEKIEGAVKAVLEHRPFDSDLFPE